MNQPGRHRDLEWNTQDADTYRAARTALTELIAVVDTRIDADPAGSAAAELRQERANLIETRRTLSVLDRDKTRHIVETYTERLRQLRAVEP